MLDVTIVYPDKNNGFWELICGHIPKVKVNVRELEIPREFLGKDYANDAQFKTDFQEWVNQLWLDKDALIDEMKAEF